MEDNRAIELFTAFRRNYREALVASIVQPPELCSEHSMPAYPAGFFYQAATDYLREISNSANQFRSWINILAAWEPVYDDCNLDDQFDLLLHHITPVSTLALSAPQALRGRMMFAASTGSSIANHHFNRDDPQLQWNHDRHLTMTIASRIGQPWTGWQRLAALLGTINPEEWAMRTSDFRNQREHGHPRNIGMGIITKIAVRDTDLGREIGFGTQAPIPIRTVIECSVERHAAVIEAYGALADLLLEQFQALLDSA